MVSFTNVDHFFVFTIFTNFLRFRYFCSWRGSFDVSQNSRKIRRFIKKTQDTRHTSHEFLHTIFPFRLGRPTTKVDDPCTWQSSVLSFFQCASCCLFSRLSTPENDLIPVSSRPSDRTVRPESEGKNPGSLRVHRKSNGIERSSSSG